MAKKYLTASAALDMSPDQLFREMFAMEPHGRAWIESFSETSDDRLLDANDRHQSLRDAFADAEDTRKSFFGMGVHKVHLGDEKMAHGHRRIVAGWWLNPRSNMWEYMLSPSYIVDPRKA